MGDKQWFVAVDGKSVGPMTETELIDGLRTGRYTVDTHVFTEGMAGWVPAGTIEELK